MPPHCRQRSIGIELVRHACGWMSTAAKLSAQSVIPRSAAGYDGACHRAALRADLMGYLAIAVGTTNAMPKAATAIIASTDLPIRRSRYSPDHREYHARRRGVR
jgi:hypothetical protein